MRQGDARRREPAGLLRRRLLSFAAGNLSALLAFAAALVLSGAVPPVPGAAEAPALMVVAVDADGPDTPAAPGAGAVSAGVGAAVDRLNSAGGVGGRRLVMVTERDACSAQAGAAAAAKVAALAPALVVGHVCSSSAIAAAPVYAAASVLMITPGATAGRLTDRRAGATIFRLAPRDDRFGPEAAALIAARFPSARVAIVADRSLEVVSLADAAARALAGLGLAPVLRESYVSGEREYHALVRRLVTAGADLLVLPAQPVEARIIFEAWRRSVPNGILVASVLLAVPDGERLAESAGERLLLLMPPRAAFDPAALAARAGAAVEAFAHAVAAAGTAEPAAVARRLTDAAMPTGMGSIAFTRSGDLAAPSLAPHVWRQGRWQEVLP